MTDISIYYDNDVCRWHLDEIGTNDCLKFNTVSDYLRSNSKTKVAILHVPYPFNIVERESFESRLNLLHDNSTRVAILVSELHEEIISFILSYQHKKIKYFTCGTIPTISHSHWLDWFITTASTYKEKPDILNQLYPYVTKPKYFDMLLGQPKPHRDFIYDCITQKNFSDQVIITYLKDFSKTLHENDETGWIWETPGVELPDYEFNWTVTMVKYYGKYISLSQVIPISIYNQTAYSVIAETNYHNHYTFFTEKTVKPILGRRLFIVFAGQHHLKNLRSLGFKTFEGIIDESYDNIEDPNKRFAAAFEQMQFLFQTPQEEILEKIKPITEHNYNVMMQDWLGNFHKEFKEFVIGTS